MAIQDYLSNINQATAPQQANLTAASNDLASLQAGAGSLPAKLKDALNTKLNNNADLINQQADTMQNYFNAGPAAREKYQNVFNPFTKANLVQQERTMALRPYDVLSGVLENRMGQVSDIVNSGVQGWQGLVNAAATKADLAKSLLSNALSSYMNAAGLQESADQTAMEKERFNESIRQFNEQLALDKYRVSLSGGGGTVSNPAEVSAIAQYIFDNNISPELIPSLTNDKNINAVLKEVANLKSAKVTEDAKVAQMNEQLAKEKKANSPLVRFGNWLKDYFAGANYSPTWGGMIITPKK